MKKVIGISLAVLLLASCNNNSNSAAVSNSDTTEHKIDSSALINTEVSGGVLPDTQINRTNSDSVSRDHTKNADTGNKPRK